MNLFDRYTSELVCEKDLPNQIDLGRYCVIEDDGTLKDVTYSTLPTKKTIRQELLLDKNKSLQEIFIDISNDIEKAGHNRFNVIPLIRRIKNKLELNEFEKLLYENIFHLEEIFRAPHYLLIRKIEKVHVSRVKRISSKSYQYTASHTEDWIIKSIVSFKPFRILSEELELNFDIYENQLTVALVERCLIYLNSRLKEIQDIKSFLFEYEKLLKNRNDEKGWHEKIKRNLKLIGDVYEDEYFKGKDKEKDGSILTKTEEVLKQIYKRLLVLKKNELFQLINKRSLSSITLRNTNVIVNHKHYRYVKTLWIKLNEINPETSESEKLRFEQSVIKGLRDYAKSLIVYALQNNIRYEISGNYSSFKAEHLPSILSKITMIENDKGVIQIIIENKNQYYENSTLNIVVIGNLPEYNEELLSILKKHNTYIFYYDEIKTIESSRLIHINPLDPDSVERVGALLRKYLLLSYLNNIKMEYKFKQILKEYVKYIPKQFIEFDIKNYTYRFHSYPKTNLSFGEIKVEVENDSIYKSRNRFDKENILKHINELLIEIEKNTIKLKEEYLKCFNCSEKLYPYYTNKLNYIKCNSCYCLINSAKPENICMKIDNEKYANLEKKDWGMDYLIFDISEL